MPHHTVGMLHTIALLLSLQPLIALGVPVAHPFYAEKAQGWFWKESPPQTPPTEDPPEREAKSLPQTESKAEDTPLTSAWFRAHLGAIRDEALDDPSPEKVKRFFLLQKALLDKAERFAETAQSVVLQDARLDERSHHPTTPRARAIRQESDAAVHHQALMALGKVAGLLFIFRSDCRYCHLMAPLIDALSEQFALRLYPVSLDGGALPGMRQGTVLADPLLGQTLHLTVTPALFLMVPHQGLYPILEGAASAMELEAHLYAAGRTAGLIPTTPIPK